MESALLEFRGTEAESPSPAVAHRDRSKPSARPATADPAYQLVMPPVPLARRTLWREIRRKIIPALVFALTIVAIVYFWP